MFYLLMKAKTGGSWATAKAFANYDLAQAECGRCRGLADKYGLNSFWYIVADVPDECKINFEVPS
jgi:hypothetical protein